MGNFTFLKNDFNDLYNSCVEAEKNCFLNPRTSAFYSRRALEIGVNLVFQLEGIIKPFNANLSELMNHYDFCDLFDDREQLELLKFVRRTGNFAVHSHNIIEQKASLSCLEIIYDFSAWIAYCYGSFDGEQAFNEMMIPKTVHEPQENLLKKVKELEEQLKTQLENSRHEKVDHKRERDFRVKNISEADTRKLYIDMQLREAGWNLEKPNTIEYKVSGMPNNSQEGYADYVLWGSDGKPLAVVEAKKTMKDPEIGKHQVTLYAECLEKEFNQYPVRFYTNGFETYIWEKKEVPRRIYGFYRKDELETVIARRDLLLPIEKARKEIKPEIAGRDYQIRAITKVVETYYNKNRKALLVMATGSGKTRTAMSIVNTLANANMVRRVLFLADRTALVNQAKNSFKNYLSDFTQCNLVEVKENDNSRLVFSTYQTMINEIDKLRKDGSRKFGVGYFDLIIIDESHRSIYKKYGAIFDYFDSMLLGLTATPKEEIDRNTYTIFDLPSGEPTDTYNLHEAAEKGYLVLPLVKEIDLKFPEKGIVYSELSEKEKEEYEDTFSDEEGNLPEKIDGNAINSWLFNSNTVEKVLETLMTSGNKIQGGDKLGKTIIFAKDDKHADFIVKTFDKLYPNMGDFCQKITNTVNYSQNLIDRFSDSKKMPQIAVSVDMLDTGIDVPEILNLVFFKKVRSKAKFWQMIGRGTRLCPNIFGPGLDKTDFYIFDFCKNFTFFETNLNELVTKLQESLTQRIFNMRISLLHKLQHVDFQADEEHKNLWGKLLALLSSDISNLDKNSAFVRKELRYVEKYGDSNELRVLDENKIIEIKNHISHLPFAIQKDDESAKRFDILILSLQLSILENTTKQKTIIRNLGSIGRELEQKGSIPKVAQNKETIKLLNDDGFWSEASIVELEEIREVLRELMKFLDKKGEQQQIFYTNFEDSIENMEVKDLGFGRYDYLDPKTKLKKILDEHQEDLAVKKLRNNIPLDHEDIENLETILFKSEIITKDELIEHCGEEFQELTSKYGENPLGYFLRSIVGLEKESVQKAFSEFLSDGNFSGKQIDFINMIVEHYIRNGNFEKSKLKEKPFSVMHTKGILGLFLKEDIMKLAQTIDNINSSAEFKL
jgi:type I restriction enzyme R subunit